MSSLKSPDTRAVISRERPLLIRELVFEVARNTGFDTKTPDSSRQHAVVTDGGVIIAGSETKSEITDEDSDDGALEDVRTRGRCMHWSSTPPKPIRCRISMAIKWSLAVYATLRALATQRNAVSAAVPDWRGGAHSRP